jgi:Domain of unknown function (DUF2804), C-terminal/Domain of unknown function (DUF2804), N-terminal
MKKNFVSEDGGCPFGVFEEPVGTINYLDYALRSPFRKLLPASEKSRQFVHFQFMGFTSDRFICGCSLTHTSQSTTVFFYLFDRKTGVTTKRGCRLGSDDTGDICLDPDNGSSILVGRGMDVRFNAHGENLEKQLLISLDGNPVLNMRFMDIAPNFETLRLNTPTGANGWSYCQKVAGTAATGNVYFDGQKFDLEEINAAAHHDFTAGFLRQETFWNWACITGRDDQGRLIGMNLSNGVNESGHSENVVWLNGKREAADLLSFKYDPDNIEAPWHITSDTGRLELTFETEGLYSAYITEGPTPCDFNQLFGRFNGYFMSQNGEKIVLKNLPGFCERQYSIWYPGA